MTPGPAAATAIPSGLLTVVDELCPFYLVADQDLHVLHAGSVLARLQPGIADGGPLAAAFAIERPHGVTTFRDIAASSRGRLAVLASQQVPALRLRGQFTLLPDGAHLLFFGAPAATSLADLTALGLSLHDMPPHQGLTDYLLVAQAQSATVLESKAMAERLRALNTQLEHRVAERTRRLQAGNARLARYSAELEKMSGQLQHEISERTRAEAERARMEEDLRLAHKLEAVGQLAAGIAHEINTPIQFVGDNLRFLQTSFDGLVAALQAHTALLPLLSPAEPGTGGAPAGHLADAVSRASGAAADADLDFLLEELPRAVAESLDGIERVGRIVRAMKEFAHPGVADFTYADVNHCVTTTLVVAHNEYARAADLVTDLDPDLPKVRCVPGEINQVLLNLVVNAAHAVADSQSATGRRGTITVSTRHRDGQAVITVRDTGGGIPPQVRARIFDPFFTTKPVGQGTGQGLSTCRTIVTTRHGGRIDVTATSGAGTEFTVLLPVEGPPRPPNG